MGHLCCWRPASVLATLPLRRQRKQSTAILRGLGQTSHRTGTPEDLNLGACAQVWLFKGNDAILFLEDSYREVKVT